MLLYLHREFEEYACEVLNKCYLENKSLSHKLVTHRQDMRSKTTLMEMADMANVMEFLSHDCCQTKLQEIWMGKMVRTTSLCKVMYEQISVSVKKSWLSYIYFNNYL